MLISEDDLQTDKRLRKNRFWTFLLTDYYYYWI